MDFDDIVLEFDGDASPSKHSTNALNSPPQLLSDQLIQAMLNERMAPSLLPYQHELLQTIINRLSNQQQLLLDSHEYGDANSGAGVLSGDFKLQLMIVETDIERFAYLVKLYLRARLSKIDKFTIYYVNEVGNEASGQSPLLSDPEITYMHQHFKILTLLYNASFLRKLPALLSLLDDSSGGQSMIVSPDIKRPVFVKCVSSQPIFVRLGEDEELQLIKDGIYVVRFELIEKYIEIGDLVLI